MTKIFKNILLGAGILSLTSLPLISMVSCSSDESQESGIFTQEDVIRLGWNKKTSITLDDWKSLKRNITEIDSNAFMRGSLVSVEIPDSVTRIGGFAFYQNKITSIKFGNSIKIIGANSFQENKLVDLHIPNSVENIGNGAFYNNEFTKSSNIYYPSILTNVHNWISIPT